MEDSVNWRQILRERVRYDNKSIPGIQKNENNANDSKREFERDQVGGNRTNLDDGGGGGGGREEEMLMRARAMARTTRKRIANEVENDDQ